jgi:hypothetical protein
VLWTAGSGGGARPNGAALGAVLAAGRLSSDQRQEILATLPDGRMQVLAARTGEVRWSGTAGTDVLAGPILSGGRSEGPAAYIADRDARVWSLVRAGGSVKSVLAWDVLTRASEGCVAAPRLLARSGRPPLLVICPTSSYADLRASVCALEPEGVRWRYAPGGTIWATPALADLNGDRRTELVVASIDVDGRGHTIGVVSVLSSEGHCLRRIELAAPVECSPAVADVDQDERLEVLVADQAGWLHCLATGRVGPVEWGLAGGDSHNTRDAENAFRYGQRSAGMQWGWKPE